MHLSVQSRFPRFRFLLFAIAPLALLISVMCSTRASAQAVDQDHIVSSQALDQQVVTSSATRQKNIDTLTNMLTMPVAQKAMHDAKVDPVQVKNAIPTLSDEELANLSGRVTKAQSDFAAGILGVGLLTLIILVIILVIVVSIVH
jgi:hypothetical protein